jgi:hypothetical protein
MSAYTPTGFNLVETMRPLEDRRMRERARAGAFDGTMQRRPPAATTRRRIQGRARRNWWMLLVPE